MPPAAAGQERAAHIAHEFDGTTDVRLAACFDLIIDPGNLLGDAVEPSLSGELRRKVDAPTRLPFEKMKRRIRRLRLATQQLGSNPVQPRHVAHGRIEPALELRQNVGSD